jgi:hypothetical protein
MSTAQPSLAFDNFFGGEAQSAPLTREDCLPPRSRTKDPSSSKRAEEDAKRSGVMRGGRVLAMELVEKYPGRTSKQLAELGTLDRYQLARRLSDLRGLKLVHTTQDRKEDLRWWPNEIRMKVSEPSSSEVR